MRIQAASEEQNQFVDLNMIYLELKETYREVYLFKADREMFLYRPLGRKDYKDLISSEEYHDLEKEEMLCRECVLWPLDYDYDSCDAGVPTALAKAILKNSFLDSMESKQLLIDVYRQEMYDLDNQVTCIINEAFPNYDIEEIETWDLQKTAKYLSRAEWKLANLRGAQFSHDPFTGKTPEEILAEQRQQEQQESVHTEPIEIPQPEPGKVETIEERQARLAKGPKSKNKMTPAQLEEMRRKYPEMEWGANVFDDVTVDNLSDSVSVDSPALRPGW